MLFNRWLLLLDDGALKVLSMVLVWLGCACVALLGATVSSQAVQWIPTTVIALLIAGEIQRLWLRYRYRQAPGLEPRSPVIRLSRPITTTELSVTRYTIATGLGCSRIRLLQLTDLHISHKLPVEYFERVSRRVASEQPDIIVLTGDFVSRRENLGLLWDWLGDLPKAPLGRFALLGNHDYWAKADGELLSGFAACGIEPLAGRSVSVVSGARGNLVLCGTEKPWGPGPSMSPVKAGDFVVMLSHMPDNVYETKCRVNLMLAGHNHGGQIRLPGLGALVVPSRYGRRFDCGQFQVGSTRLIVSRGIGADAPHLRIYCPPEVVVVDLT